MNRERVQLQPAFVLHQRNYRDSSRLVDVFCRDFGRLRLVARGVRRPRSRLRSVLMPFQPVLLSWTRRGELGTLTGAESGGDAIALRGDALLAGYYVNELIIRLLDGDEPQELLFADYAATLGRLAEQALQAAALRRFEKRLLDALGYGLVLDHEAEGARPLRDDGIYAYHPQSGPQPLADDRVRDATPAYRGDVLLAIAREDFSDADTLRAARQILRSALDIYLDGRPLRTRDVARAMHRESHGGSAS